MHLTPYLCFNGQCAAAFKFYEQCFHGTIRMIQTYGESPMKDQEWVTPDWQDKVTHATLIVGDRELMGSDVPPAQYTVPQGFAVSISIALHAEAERVFNALADQGKVETPFQKTYWSSGFGVLVDRFGIPWIVQCEEAP